MLAPNQGKNVELDCCLTLTSKPAQVKGKALDCLTKWDDEASKSVEISATLRVVL